MNKQTYISPRAAIIPIELEGTIAASGTNSVGFGNHFDAEGATEQFGTKMDGAEIWDEL